MTRCRRLRERALPVLAAPALAVLVLAGAGGLHATRAQTEAQTEAQTQTQTQTQTEAQTQTQTRDKDPSPVPAQTLVRTLARAGLSQPVLILSPPAPRAVLVMLPGGTGKIGLAPDGRVAHGLNILVRTRARFVAAGFAVVIPDAANGKSLRGRRSTPAYGAVVEALAALAGQETGAPVVLIGTSQGAIAAMNGAARLKAGAIRGLVLIESVSRLGGSKESVFDANPGAVQVPVLVMANRADTCPVSPPDDAAKIAQSLVQAPDVRVLTLSGGVPTENPCSSRAPHGYWGMDEQVVGAITSWIETRLKPADSAPAR